MAGKGRSTNLLEPTGGLARLLAVEATLDRMLADRAAEAEAIVAAAREAAARLLERVETDLTSLGRAETAALDAATGAHLEALAARAEERCRRWEAARTDQLDRLADLVVAAVLDDLTAGTGP